MVSNGTGPYLKSCTSLLQKDSQCSQPQPLSSQATHPTSQGLSPPHQDPAGALPSCSLWPQTRSSQWAQIPFSALLRLPVAPGCSRAREPHGPGLFTGPAILRHRPCFLIPGAVSRGSPIAQHTASSSVGVINTVKVPSAHLAKSKQSGTQKPTPTF